MPVTLTVQLASKTAQATKQLPAVQVMAVAKVRVRIRLVLNSDLFW